MGLKQWLRTRWNGDNQHKNGLNTDKNTADSSKHKTTKIEIQARDDWMYNPPPPHPPPTGFNSEGLIYGYTCSRLPSAPRTTNAISCIYSYKKKGLLQLTLGNPLLLNWNIQSWNYHHFQKCWEGSYFSPFFYPFSPSTLKYMCVSCRSCDDTLEKVCLFQYHLIYMHIYPLFNEKKKGLIPLES